MKHAFRLILAGLTAGLLSTLTAAAAPVPVDTVAGQARFVHRMSAGMCDRLAQEGQKADLSKLTAAESEALLKRVMLGAMGDNFAEFSALMEKAGTISPADLGRAIGEQAVLEMMGRCASAGSLLAKIGGARTGTSIEVTPAERPTLLAVTQAACKQFDAENAKQPIDKLTPSQRASLIEQVIGGVFLSHSEELAAQYGDDVMTDKAQLENIGRKVGILMLETCPTYILQAGRDEIARRQSPATPTAKPKAPIPGKAPVKKLPAKVR